MWGFGVLGRQHHHRLNLRRVLGTTNLLNRDVLHRFVQQMYLDRDIAQGAAAAQVFGQAVQRGQRIAGNHTQPVLDDVALVVILRRFDQIKHEFAQHNVLPIALNPGWIFDPG